MAAEIDQASVVRRAVLDLDARELQPLIAGQLVEPLGKDAVRHAALLVGAREARAANVVAERLGILGSLDRRGRLLAAATSRTT